MQPNSYYQYIPLHGRRGTHSLAENPRFPQGKLVALVVHEVHKIKILRGNY